MLAAGAAGCQRADERSADTDSTTLTVYASMPLEGAEGSASEDVVNGVRLALRQSGGRAGSFTVKLAVLDDSTPATQRWDGRQTADNARIAVRDSTAIAYLGDGPSGATAISLPILNAAGILQVSPASTYAGLTRSEGAAKGEPEKYYPAGTRTFARTVPNDRAQAEELVAQVREQGCRALAVLDDRDLAGRGLATQVQREAARARVRVVGRDSLRADADAAAAAAAVVGAGADCVAFGGTGAGWVVRLFDALHRTKPTLRLFGGAGLSRQDFAGALAPGTQARTQLTLLRAPAGPPGSPARRWAKAYADAFGRTPGAGAAYGYEAMRLVLDAITAAGDKGGNRTAVARALFGLGERSGPLGPFRLDARGDTTVTGYGAARVVGGRLVPSAALRRTAG